jgi:hypothetical protein
MPLESGSPAWAKELAGFTITRLSAIVELTTYDIVLMATTSWFRKSSVSSHRVARHTRSGRVY